MTPDSVENRVGHNERILAGLQVEMRDVLRRVDRHDEIPVQMAELRGQLTGIDRGLHSLTESMGSLREAFRLDVKAIRDEDIGELKEQLEAREREHREAERDRREERRRERRERRIAIIALGGAVVTGLAGIVAALIGAAG